MDSSHASAPGAPGSSRQRSLPGFSAFLRPHSHLPTTTSESAAVPFKHERERPSYLPSASSVFVPAFRRPEDPYDDHQHPQHPHHYHHHQYPHHQHQYTGLHSLRPPVVALAPPPYAGAASSPIGTTSKHRKVHAHDSPSASARRLQRPLHSSSPPSSSSVASPFELQMQRHQQQQQQHRQSVRTSRYLRETDRRAILQRIENGEKQADLAKEYQVSRAAISNLKQRRRLKDKQLGGASPSSGLAPVTARAGRSGEEDDDDGEERDEHDQRRPRHRSSSDECSSHSESLARDEADAAAVRAVAGLRQRPHMHSGASPATSASSPSSSTPRPHALSWSQASPSALDLGRESVVRGASVPLLLAQLQRGMDDNAAPPGAFRVTAQRLVRLLLEETLGRLPTRPLTPRDSNADSGGEALLLARPVCAIAVDDGRGSELLLDEFRAIEPLCGVGAVRTKPRPAESPLATLVHAPEHLTEASVLLLDLACSETGDELYAAVETLQESGVDPRNVFVATLVGYASGIARVWGAFPQLGDLLTTKLLHPTAPGSTDTHNEVRDLVRQLQTRLTLAP